MLAIRQKARQDRKWGFEPWVTVPNSPRGLRPVASPSPQALVGKGRMDQTLVPVCQGLSAGRRTLRLEVLFARGG